MNRNWNEMKWLRTLDMQKTIYILFGHWNQDNNTKKTDNFCTDFFNCLIFNAKLNDNWMLRVQKKKEKKNCCAFVDVWVFKCFRRHFIVYSYFSILLNESPFCLDVLVCSTFRQTYIDLYEAMICCWWCRFLPFYHIILLYCALYCIVMGWVFYLLK